MQMNPALMQAYQQIMQLAQQGDPFAAQLIPQWDSLLQGMATPPAPTAGLPQQPAPMPQQPQPSPMQPPPSPMPPQQQPSPPAWVQPMPNNALATPLAKPQPKQDQVHISPVTQRLAEPLKPTETPKTETEEKPQQRPRSLEEAILMSGARVRGFGL